MTALENTIPAARVASLRLGLMAADRRVHARIRAVAATAGSEIALTSTEVEALVSSHAAEPLDAVLVAIPDTDGRNAALEALTRDLEAVPVIVIVKQEQNGVRRLLDKGASAIVLEADLPATLTATLEAAVLGLVVVPRSLSPSARPALLSHREKQVLGLVVMGFTNGQIATRLYLAESTVKSHLSSAFAKLGVRSRNEASALLSDPQQIGLGVLTIARD